MIKFIDANIFIERWSNAKARELIDNLDREQHCTSVLALAEVYHKLKKKDIDSFEYLRNIMGAIKVQDVTTADLFNAMKSNIDININDRIHIATMKRNDMNTIVSQDTDFDKDSTIVREEL